MVMAVFGKLNFFNTMNTSKNFARLFLCIFAIVGLTACSGNSTGSVSSGGGGDSVTLTDRVNQNTLSSYTLQNLDDTFLDEIEQEIAEKYQYRSN